MGDADFGSGMRHRLYVGQQQLSVVCAVQVLEAVCAAGALVGRGKAGIRAAAAGRRSGHNAAAATKQSVRVSVAFSRPLL